MKEYEDLHAEARRLGFEAWRITPGVLESLVRRAYELGQIASRASSEIIITPARQQATSQPIVMDKEGSK